MKIDWHSIDTVLLDMDGTLLDLHFDNFFWLEYLPQRYAEHHGICPNQATRDLHQRFNEKQGSLEWYCLDYWSRELSVDISQLKKEIRYLINERPQVIEFLETLGKHNKQRILITNAHPHSLELKLSATRIGPLLDKVISSHQFGAPKEEQSFWRQLYEESPFKPDRTLFIDDSESILTSAQKFGIANLLCISQPDSKRDPRLSLKFPAIEHFNQIMALETTND